MENGDAAEENGEEEGPVDPRWLASPMLRFLQTLHNHKVDRDAKGVTKADLDAVLQQVCTVPPVYSFLLFL